MNLRVLLDQITAELSSSPALAGRGPLGHESEILVLEAWRSLADQGQAGPVPSALERQLSPIRIDVPKVVEQTALAWTVRRSSGELLQHIVGQWHFLNHEYEVGPQVLVPRPETETLVQNVGDILEASLGISGAGLGAEIGLGSGIISIELLSRFPALRMVASDVSAEALETARRNALKILGDPTCDRLLALRTDPGRSPCRELEPHLRGRKLSFIVSNPPYLYPAPASQEVESDVRAQEPGLALFAPQGDLLYFYRDIADCAAYLLEKGGFIGVEIPHERSGSLKELFESRRFRVEIRKDLTGRDRVLLAWPSQA